MPKKTEDHGKFAKFIRGFGVEDLARRLDVNPSAIYHWLRGKTIPDPKNALKVQKLAKRRGIELSLNEIYEPSREVRSETSSLKPQQARA